MSYSPPQAYWQLAKNRRRRLAAAAAQSAGFTDSFDRADANLEASANWTHDGLVVGGAAIRSNRLASMTSDGTGTAYKSPDLGSANHYVQFEARGSGTASTFVCCRLADRQNFVGAIVNSSAGLEVWKKSGGTFSSLFAGSAGGVAVGNIVRLEAQGGNWAVFLNGVQLSSGAIGDAGLTSTRQGIVVGFALQNPSIDNYQAGLV